MAPRTDSKKKAPEKPNAVVFDSSHYQVLTNSDLTEGRGETVLIGRAFTRDRALDFAKGQGVMGTDAKVELVAETLVAWNGGIFVLTPAKMLTRESQEEIARRGLAKLTVEEKVALGLTAPGTERRR